MMMPSDSSSKTNETASGNDIPLEQPPADVAPAPLRTAHARTRLRTLFLPGAGFDSVRSQRVAMAAARDKRPAVRETATYILGILESPAAAPVLINALNDPEPT